jgi:hypothetical protein
MTPQLIAALKTYANTHTRSVDEIFETMAVEPAFSDRVRSWLSECGQAPERFLNPERASTAVCDLIALQLCCYGFSIVDQELNYTDLGGAASTFQVLIDFLKLVAMHDMKLAEDLTVISHDYARQQLKKIKELIPQQR